MDLREFQEAGWLQEINRRMLHPAGLALTLYTDDDGAQSLWIQDDRDDPEGWVFDPPPSETKASNVRSQELRRARARVKTFGFVVQPCEDDTGSSS